LPDEMAALRAGMRVRYIQPSMRKVQRLSAMMGWRRRVICWRVVVAGWKEAIVGAWRKWRLVGR